MNNEFVSYEIALALKQLDFDEPCFVTYQYPSKDLVRVDADSEGVRNSNLVRFTSAPLIQQAFRWFREKYDLYSHVRESLGFDNTLEFVAQINGSYVNHGIKDKPINRFETYEEAELTCLQKMIEIVTNNKMTNKEKFMALVSGEDDQTLVGIKERIKNRELKNEKISDETISKTLQKICS